MQRAVRIKLRNGQLPRAKAETLHLWEDDDRAATLMERWV